MADGVVIWPRLKLMELFLPQLACIHTSLLVVPGRSRETRSDLSVSAD